MVPKLFRSPAPRHRKCAAYPELSPLILQTELRHLQKIMNSLLHQTRNPVVRTGGQVGWLGGVFEVVSVGH